MSVLQREVAAQNGGGTVRAPRFEVDPFWPKPLPESLAPRRRHRRVGGRARSHLDHSSQLGDTEQQRARRGAEPADRRVLQGRAARAGVRRARGTSFSRGAGPGRATNGRSPTMGSSSTTRATSGSAAMARVIRTSSSSRGPASSSRSTERPACTKGPSMQKGLSTYAGDSNDQQNFGRVAKIFVDPRDNEAYIADGYLNKRVAVLDADTGKMKRYWGAYGNKPDDRNLGPYNPDAPPAQQFRNPVHCADVSNDGLVYVCDRVNTRLQVFTKEGKFVKENLVREAEPGRRIGVGRRVLEGSAADLHLHGRRTEPAGSRHPARHARGADGVRRRRALSRAVLRRPQHRDRLEGQPVHDGNLRRQAPAEVRLPGRRRRAEVPGRCLAGQQIA